MAKVFVKFRKARPFWFGHPWVFSGAVDRVRGKVKDGDVVELCDHDGRLIGQGFFNGRSQIRVRLTAMAFEGPLDEALLIRRLDRAIDLRRDILKLDAVTNACRLVHSEGDGIPGFIADKIGDYVVVQVTALGVAPYVPKLVERLVERVAPNGVLERASRVGLEEEGLIRADGVLAGAAPTEPVEVVEHGVRYFVDVVGGQKTGWYCDQRDNRRAVLPFLRGRATLDAFSYVGGFGLAALKDGGAASVHFLDSSGPAIELAKRGAAANGVADRATFEEGNVLRVLDKLARDGRKFDAVIVDPPKLVHRRLDVDKGMRLYLEINEKALAVLNDGGVLITCSCSQHVGESYFEDMAATAAKEALVRLQLLHRGGQGADHPITLPHSESRYLKFLAFRVQRGDPRFLADYGRATEGEPKGAPSDAAPEDWGRPSGPAEDRGPG